MDNAFKQRTPNKKSQPTRDAITVSSVYVVRKLKEICQDHCSDKAKVNCHNLV